MSKRSREEKAKRRKRVKREKQEAIRKELAKQTPSEPAGPSYFEVREKEYLEKRNARAYYCRVTGGGLVPSDIELYCEGYEIVFRESIPEKELERILSRDGEIY